MLTLLDASRVAHQRTYEREQTDGRHWLEKNAVILLLSTETQSFVLEPHFYALKLPKSLSFTKGIVSQFRAILRSGLTHFKAREQGVIASEKDSVPASEQKKRIMEPRPRNVRVMHRRSFLKLALFVLVIAQSSLFRGLNLRRRPHQETLGGDVDDTEINASPRVLAAYGGCHASTF